MSSRPSLSKSSMIAPPAWLKRLTPTRWPTSRNLPMSNSEWKKRSRSSRNRGSTLSGYSPRVMWARLSSQRTSRSSGNCSRYSVKCLIASREPVGLVWTAAGEMGRMQELSPRHMMQLSFSPRRSAVTPWK